MNNIKMTDEHIFAISNNDPHGPIFNYSGQTIKANTVDEYQSAIIFDALNIELSDDINTEFIENTEIIEKQVTLNLSYRGIPKGISFDGINILCLSNCRLADFPYFLPAVTELDISCNQITSIHNLNLPNLKVLYAGNNLLISVDNIDFPNLEILYIDHNSVQRIKKLDLPKLIIFSAVNNHMRYIKLISETITNLNLSINKLTNLSSLFLPALVCLNISKNKISKINCLNSKQLISLNINNTKIKFINIYLFNKLKYVWARSTNIYLHPLFLIDMDLQNIDIDDKEKYLYSFNFIYGNITYNYMNRMNLSDQLTCLLYKQGIFTEIQKKKEEIRKKILAEYNSFINLIILKLAPRNNQIKDINDIIYSYCPKMDNKSLAKIITKL